MKTSRKLHALQQPQSLIDHIRQFLTPQLWKQARQAVPNRRQRPRWDFQPLVILALAMTWAAGDSQAETFETARGFYVSSHAARRRPGATLQGFQKALARVPLRQFRTLAAGVRDQIRARDGQRLIVEGFEPFGCDGSRVECPRAAQLEARLRLAGKTDSAPTLWVTALVHLGTGLLWSWQLGPGTADERVHLRRLLETLPKTALVVADAAYMGYDLIRTIIKSERSFLFRMSSKVDLYTKEHAELTTWDEGPVYCWPQYVQNQGLPPIPCRLIRVPARGQIKHDVWLLTDVLDPKRLTAETAAQFYRWRWRNEGVFRTYKRTIKKLKFSSRTVALVHREAEVSLLSLQILLTHADLALRGRSGSGKPAIRPRQVLKAIRQELGGVTGRRVVSYRRRLQSSRAKDRVQTSPKVSREWPRRKPHKPPKPPILKTLNNEQKALLEQHFKAA